jgi:hypothetical protein
MIRDSGERTGVLGIDPDFRGARRLREPAGEALRVRVVQALASTIVRAARRAILHRSSSPILSGTLLKTA